MANRGILMTLLALDLFVMGTSSYFIWNRLQKRLAAPPAPNPVAAKSAPRIEPSEENQEDFQEAQEPAQPALPTVNAQKETQKSAARVAAAPAQRAHPEQTVPAKNKRKIKFQYRDPVSKRVSIAGDFNRWNPQLLKKDEHSNWSITLELNPGDYAYNFIVDGKMIRDPSNRKTKKAGRKIASSLLIVKSK